MLIWSGVIPAEAASKGNSRRVFRHGDRIRFAKSDKAMHFMHQAEVHLNPPATPIDHEVCMVATLYYASNRPDLDESLVMDALQKCGVIKNDRLIREKHIQHGLDRDKPRVEIELWPRSATMAWLQTEVA